MNINKTIFNIDSKYKNLLRVICTQVLDKFTGLPLDWEDIYYAFLIKVPKLIKEFDVNHESHIEFQTFIGIKCKHFALNYCRGFDSNKHKVMNKAIFIKEEEKLSRLQDIVKIKKPKIDIGIFNKDEFQFYKKHTLDGLSLIEIAKDMDISIYKVNILKTKVETKIYLQYKN